MTQGDIHSSEGKSKLQYHVFDIVSASSNLYRLNTLNDLLGGQKYNFVRLVHSSVVPRNLSAIETVLNTCVELGHEGIVIRHLYAPYERKRSLWVMKYKPKKTDFYKIVGWEEECSLDGTPKGRLGALWCIGDSGQKFKVALSATKHDIREVFWPVRDSLPGEYLRVHYQALTARKVPYFGRANLALDLSIVSKEEVQDDNLETNS
jgi:ATP-dependent DNA ligase